MRRSRVGPLRQPAGKWVNILFGSVTTAPLERLTEPPTGELAELFALRAGLTRYLVNVSLSLPGMP